MNAQIVEKILEHIKEPLDSKQETLRSAGRRKIIKYSETDIRVTPAFTDRDLRSRLLFC